MVKFMGYDYREEPSPHRVPVFEVEEGDTLEDLKKAEEEGKKNEGNN